MLSACGQYVYNLRTQRGTTCQCSSTDIHTPTAIRPTMWVNTQVIRSVMPILPLYESTPIFRKLSLLIHSYTHNPQPLLLPPQEKI